MERVLRRSAESASAPCSYPRASAPRAESRGVALGSARRLFRFKRRAGVFVNFRTREVQHLGCKTVRLAALAHPDLDPGGPMALRPGHRAEYEIPDRERVAEVG